MSPHHDTEWILVVEDQFDLWVLIKTHLTRALPLVQLVHFTNAPTALNYLQSRSQEGKSLPRLVLSDLYVPQLDDGLGFLTSLKEPTSNYRHLLTVVMSSSTNDKDRHEVNRRGGIYLPKPMGAQGWSEFIRSIYQYWRDSIRHHHDR